jgi:hypothetical protein
VDCPRPGIYSEYMHAILGLAHINYTIVQSYINLTVNMTWGAYVEDIDWFDGLLGELKDNLDLIVSPYSVSDPERARLLLWLVPGGAAGLSVVYQQETTSFWKQTSWPLRVFSIDLWALQFASFLVGVLALTLSRYFIRRYVMYEVQRRSSMFIDTYVNPDEGTSSMFAAGLFHYYAVMVAQGWELAHICLY